MAYTVGPRLFAPYKSNHQTDRQTDRKQLSSQNSQTEEVVSQNRQTEEGIEEVIIMLYDGYYDQNGENGENMWLWCDLMIWWMRSSNNNSSRSGGSELVLLRILITTLVIIDSVGNKKTDECIDSEWLDNWDEENGKKKRMRFKTMFTNGQQPLRSFKSLSFLSTQ